MADVEPNISLFLNLLGCTDQHVYGETGECATATAVSASTAEQDRQSQWDGAALTSRIVLHAEPGL